MADISVQFGKSNFWFRLREIKPQEQEWSALFPEYLTNHKSLTFRLNSFWSPLPTVLNLLCCWKVCRLFLTFRRVLFCARMCVCAVKRVTLRWKRWLIWEREPSARGTHCLLQHKNLFCVCVWGGGEVWKSCLVSVFIVLCRLGRLTGLVLWTNLCCLFVKCKMLTINKQCLDQFYQNQRWYTWPRRLEKRRPIVPPGPVLQLTSPGMSAGTTGRSVHLWHQPTARVTAQP